MTLHTSEQWDNGKIVGWHVVGSTNERATLRKMLFTSNRALLEPGWGQDKYTTLALNALLLAALCDGKPSDAERKQLSDIHALLTNAPKTLMPIYPDHTKEQVLEMMMPKVKYFEFDWLGFLLLAGS